MLRNFLTTFSITLEGDEFFLNVLVRSFVTSLCDALKHPSCKITKLILSGNEITDIGVTSLCDSLKHPSCKVTTLI